MTKGKLTLGRTPTEWWNLALRHAQRKEMPVDSRIALRATALPPLHSDLFDRIVVATAHEMRLTLLTPDPKIYAYPDVEFFW